MSWLQKWVWAFRSESFIVGVHTNNGLERQNQVFKYTYLKHHKNNSLSGVLSILIEEFLPDNYNRYVKERLNIIHQVFHPIFCILSIMTPSPMF